MKRRILTFVLVLVFGILAITACDKNDWLPVDEDSWGQEYTVAAAYTKAVELGYEDSLEEFIETISGKDGIDGKDGVGILDITVTNGRLLITLTNEKVIDCGVIVGADGEDGKDGETPYIGENGNWWIGDTDTSVKAEGKDGKDGEDLTACAHEYGAWSVGIAPSCESIGYNKRICTKCQDKDYEFIAAKGHTYGEYKTIVVTETEHIKYAGCLECEHSKIISVCSYNFSEGLEYTISNDGTFYSVTGIGTCTDNELIIPGTYNNKPVKEIGDEAFKNNTSITSVVIPDSVTSIVRSAFRDCSSLTSVTIGNGVISIGYYAFGGCTSLNAVYITDIAKWYAIDFNNFDANPLYNAKNLYLNGELVTDLVIPDGVISIGYYAFGGCTSLISVTIPDSVTSIGGAAFNGCSSLNAVYITDIAKWCAIDFGGTDSHFRYKGTNPLEYAKNLYLNGELVTDLVIPDGVISIGDDAFYGCSSLTSVTIPDSVTSIGHFAFEDCSSLTSVTIGNGVTSIGNNAFSDCSSLNAVYITDIAKWCAIDFGGSGANPLYYAKNLYLNGELVTDLVIPDGVTSIGNYAFYNCTSLTSVTIPDSVTSIGEDAFNGCSSLISVTIPDSVTSIGESAFYGCWGLTSATIDNGVTSIGDYAFYNCSSLTSVTIPDSVTSIGVQAFYNCSSLTSITIGNSVTSIGDDAFSVCSSLTSITVDKNNTAYKSINGNLYTKDGKTLVQYAIGKTDTSFTIPDSVTSIGNYAFAYCSSLTTVTIGNGVTNIGDYAFIGCWGLTSITIPDSVTSIGSYAFIGCWGLTSIIVDENNTAYKSIDGNLYTKDGKRLIQYAIGKTDTSFVIPNGVTSIGSAAFAYCSSLTTVIIGNGVTSIGYYAFRNCSSLSSITIPDSVTSIGDEAFYDCDGLTDVYFTGSEEEWNEITIDYLNEDLTNATIHYNYVPEE